MEHDFKVGDLVDFINGWAKGLTIVELGKQEMRVKRHINSERTYIIDFCNAKHSEIETGDTVRFSEHSQSNLTTFSKDIRFLIANNILLQVDSVRNNILEVLPEKNLFMNRKFNILEVARIGMPLLYPVNKEFHSKGEEDMERTKGTTKKVKRVAPKCDCETTCTCKKEKIIPKMINKITTNRMLRKMGIKRVDINTEKRAVAVSLKNGITTVSHCDTADHFDSFVGFSIAYTSAMATNGNKKLTKDRVNKIEANGGTYIVNYDVQS